MPEKIEIELQLLPFSGNGGELYTASLLVNGESVETDWSPATGQEHSFNFESAADRLAALLTGGGTVLDSTPARKVTFPSRVIEMAKQTGSVRITSNVSHVPPYAGKLTIAPRDQK